jgi:hypothetical protein
MRVDVDASGERAGAPVDVTTRPGSVPAGASADGRVLLQRSSDGPTAHGTLTLEWIKELREKLGPPAAALPR